MNYCLLVLIGFASPALTAVYRQQVALCSAHEFACADGACVSRDRRCDGARDCADGSDERACALSSNSIDLRDIVIHRYVRQTKCGSNQFRCRDGTCISFDGKCDGVADCPDRSDETHALCRNMPCPSHLFRCTYGACVDGTAACNGVQECDDNSDELLPRCRNEVRVTNGKFTCKRSGKQILSTDLCDGVLNCGVGDNSDETLEACGDIRCAYAHLFQCAYGACVDAGADCNGIRECADGSDEGDELCNRTTIVTSTDRPQNVCVLPSDPENGRYEVTARSPDNRPIAGRVFDSFVLKLHCHSGFYLSTPNNHYVDCLLGNWTKNIPKCIRYCELKKHPSVLYKCGDAGKECDDFVPAGMSVNTECRRPNYYRVGLDVKMRCTDSGYFDRVLTCQPDWSDVEATYHLWDILIITECGTISPEGQELLFNGTRVDHGRFPWHTGIYTKDTTPYMQICGGSLITTNIVISAAHCFWKSGAVAPHSNYAVAIGKIYRPWNNPRDAPQRSDVADIKIPPQYADSEANFQSDIAIVTLVTPVKVTPYVRPVCLDFGYEFDEKQLKEGNTGEVTGWGLTETGKPSPFLLYSRLPYVDILRCTADMPALFRPFITSDKICAGTLSGTSLCRGDSGGGLVFPQQERDGLRYYLRGIVSTAPANKSLACNPNSYTTFTHVLNHEHFIKTYLP